MATTTDNAPSADAVKAFTREFSERVDRGETLTRALSDIAAQTPDKTVAQAAQSAIADLRAGNTLSAAFGKYPALFGSDYLVVVRQGEISGRLDDALRILA